MIHIFLLESKALRNPNLAIRAPTAERPLSG